MPAIINKQTPGNADYLPAQKTILIAEDDRFLSKVLSDKLKRIGYGVITASDGVEAISKINQIKVDLVLLDLIMPNKDGFEVLEEIKSSPEFKDLPIVILSNLGQEADVEKGKKLGATDYLVKSNLAISQVVDKISDYLSGK